MAESTNASDPSPGNHPVFLPLLLLALALTLMTGFQSVQLAKERDLLNARLLAQSEPVKESTSVREQFQSIATATAALAKAGNSNAEQIMTLLQRSGISVSLDEPVTAEQ